MSFVREIIDALVKEIKAVLTKYVNELDAALKKRLQRLLVSGIIVSVLWALVISLAGSAILFLLIASLKYLIILMPEWQAWGIMGLTSAAIGGMLFCVLFFFIRKQLRTKQT